MRLFLLLCFLCLIIPSVNCQQIYLEGGKTTSSFDYTNSFGEPLENLQTSSHSFLTIGYRKSVFTQHLYLNLNASYNSYGAIGSDVAFDNYFEWDINYLGVGFGFDYQFYRPGNFSFYAKVSATGEFLVQGSQTVNNQVYNLSAEEDFDSAIYVFRGGIGVQYKISENLTVFNQYMYGLSGAFKNIQGILKIKTHNFGLGLLVNISKNQLEGKGGVNNAQLEELKKAMEANSQKLKTFEESYNTIKQLEKENAAKDKQIASKDKEIQSIKRAISDALSPYRGTDLNVEERHGKIYVTLDSDVIFSPGSSKVKEEGIIALNEFGDVLANNPDLTIFIEGHTDDTPYENGDLDNRSLSLQRATSIIKILSTNNNINPKNIILSGRGEFDPKADNITKEGKASNRRIEILIAPKLDKLSQLIKN